MKALDDLFVVDLCRGEAGPVCTENLAFMGAEVVMVEEAGKRSRARRGVVKKGGLINILNKKSVTLNLKAPEGKETMWKMLEKADVFVENRAPGACDRLGFSWEEVHKRNPKLIYVSIKGFSRGSEWEKAPSFDPIGCAMGGAQYINGEVGGNPLQPGPNLADSGAAHMATIGLLGALHQRERTGEGQLVEVSLQDTVVQFCRSAYEAYYAYGKNERVGNGHPQEKVAPVNVYPCKGEDEWVHIYVSRTDATGEQFRDLMRVCGRPDLAEDPRMQTPDARYEFREMLDEVISNWTRQHDKFEVMRILAMKHFIPTGAVLNMGDILNDQFLREEGLMQEVSYAETDDFWTPTTAVKMSASSVEATGPSVPGADNEEIFIGKLGMTKEEYQELLNKGVC